MQGKYATMCLQSLFQEQLYHITPSPGTPSTLQHKPCCMLAACRTSMVQAIWYIHGASMVHSSFARTSTVCMQLSQSQATNSTLNKWCSTYIYIYIYGHTWCIYGTYILCQDIYGLYAAVSISGDNSTHIYIYTYLKSMQLSCVHVILSHSPGQQHVLLAGLLDGLSFVCQHGWSVMCQSFVCHLSVKWYVYVICMSFTFHFSVKG